MIELLSIYKWTLAAGLLGGTALALIGSQLAARNQSMQTLVISQAASLGVVLGLTFRALGGYQDHLHEHGLLPVFCGIGLAFLFHMICEFLISHRWVSRGTYYVGIFALLMAMNYSVISLVPSLETHMAAAYFGDLTVASHFETLLVAMLGFIAVVFCCIYWPRITYWSFEALTFGSFVAKPADRRIQLAFVATSLLVVAASVQFLGLLFTLSCLFVPSMILVRLHQGAALLPSKIAISTLLGVALGFIMSLENEKLPPVPAIAIALIGTTFVVGFVSRRSIR